MIREAYEEAGITIKASDLRLVYTSFRKTNWYALDLFFECSNWEGVVKNMEPHKCGELSFFPLEDLPENLIPYVKKALLYEGSHPYSEEGWEAEK